jgi:hypothetical protein
MMAIMTNTPWDPNKRFRNATGEAPVDTLFPPSDQYPGAVAVYVRRGYSDFKVGQDVTYENGNTIISGKIRAVNDIPSQSFLVYEIPYGGSDMTAAISGGKIYPTSGAVVADVLSSADNSGIKAADLGSGSQAANSMVQKLKTYAPFIILGVVVVGAIIYKLKKSKK